MTETNGAQTDTSDMRSVHQVLRSSLASAPEFIGSAAGDDERRALIANYYMNVVCFLQVHHDGEEALVFPRLAERAPEHQALVATVEGEHRQVVDLMADVDAKRAAWEAGGDPAADDLLRALRALDEVLTPHLDREEAEILLAAAYLSPEEWGQLPGHAMGNFEGDKVWLILGLIRENLTQGQRDMMLEHMPPPARQMWEGMGEASFNQLIAEVRQPT